MANEVANRFDSENTIPYIPYIRHSRYSSIEMFRSSSKKILLFLSEF